jgi:hypothetical protein
VIAISFTITQEAGVRSDLAARLEISANLRKPGELTNPLAE